MRVTTCTRAPSSRSTDRFHFLAARSAPPAASNSTRQLILATAAHQSEDRATRRDVLGVAVALAAVPPFTTGRPAPARAEEPSSSGSSESNSSEALVAFADSAQGYSIQRPATWEQVDKPGADCLFRNPERHSNTLGVTVLPVMIKRLEDFGDLNAVGERLLSTERAKESTLSVRMVSQQQRSAPSTGGLIYDFNYELESTRGRKRILSTVTVVNSKLYIANGNISCGKEGSCNAAAMDIALLQRAARSLAVR